MTIKLRAEGLSRISLTKLFGGAAQLEADEWRREPAVQVHQSRAGEVYESAPRSRWTIEPPTHPGLFFCRVPGGETRIVEVYRQHGALRFGWSDIPSAPVRNAGLEWSDREIQPPVEGPAA